MSKIQTVLFADLCNSSNMFAELGSARALGIVEEFLAVCSRAVEENKGRLVKTVGDGAIYVFDNPNNCVMAANMLMNMVSDTNFQGRRLSGHLGISIGEVTIEGNDVYGESVNSAAHLSEMAGPEQVLFDSATFRQLSPEMQVLVRPVTRALIKGTSQESTIYEVIWRPELSTQINPIYTEFQSRPETSITLEWEGKTIRLDSRRPFATIGRSDQCDIMLERPFVSREHAYLEKEGDGFAYEDRSTNGTLVYFDNGRRIHLIRRRALLDSPGRLIFGRVQDGGQSLAIRFVPNAP